MDHAEAENDALLGQSVGNYEVKLKLGEGGMGSVYLAEHPRIGKKVALKILHPDLSNKPDVVDRFFHEAKAVNDIQHRNIIDIIDFGDFDDAKGNKHYYFIMEFLNGRSLAEILDPATPMEPEKAIGICLQIADALAASHQHGVVHRDLKPDNIILVHRRHEPNFVKLLDFGIAKLTGDQHQSRKTRTGIVMGTPAYMSPEQCEGRGRIDHRTDVYALGILLYEMIAGQVPFTGEGYGEVLVQHLTQKPAPPSTLRGMIPPHLEMICLKALEKERDKRFPSMAEFMRALADPVGYIDSRGGLQGFLEMPLTDSGELPPHVRAGTATPMPSAMSPTPGYRTPTPGQLMSPAPGQLHTPVPGQLHTPVPGQLHTPVPGQQYTTGQYANGVSQTLPPTAAPSKVWFAAGGLALLAVIAVAVVMGGAGDKAPVAASPEPATETETAAVVPETVEPTTVEIKIRSTPVGATVSIDGVEKGVTPLTLPVEQSDDKITVLISAEGFEDKSRTFTPNENQAMDLELRKAKKAGPTPAEKNAAAEKAAAEKAAAAKAAAEKAAAEKAERAAARKAAAEARRKRKEQDRAKPRPRKVDRDDVLRPTL